MKERGISEGEVREAVLYPNKWNWGKDGEIIAVRKFGSREIRVAYLSEPKAIKVITVMKR